MKRRNFISLSLALISVKVFPLLSKEKDGEKYIALKELMQGKKNIVVPKGNYFINEPINVPSNTKLVFEEGAMIYVTAEAHVKCIFSINNASHIKIIGGVFHALDDTCEVINIKNASDSISIDGLTCFGLRLGSITNEDNNRYASNDNIMITNCSGMAQNIRTRKAFLEFRYVNDSSCSKCNIKGYYHGLLFWGGDANPKHSKDRNKRCSNIILNNNHVYDVVKGGIWGAMAERVLITENYVENGGDVGIDFEGCTGCVASKNTVKYFKNGGLSTFFVCNDIVFEFNNIACSDKTDAGAIFNSSQRRNNKNIIFRNNSFLSKSGISRFAQHGAVDDLLIERNRFNNVAIKLDSNNNGDITIKDNSFYYSERIIHELSFIKISNVNKPHAVITIVGNDFKSITDNTDSRMGVIEINKSKAPKVIIKNNTNNADRHIKFELKINAENTDKVLDNNSNITIETMNAN